MKVTNHADEQISFALKQSRTGVPIGEICRETGIVESTLFQLEKEICESGVNELRRLKQLEEENRKLK